MPTADITSHEPNSHFVICRISLRSALFLGGASTSPGQNLMVVGRVLETLGRGEYQSMRSALCASAPSHPLHVMPPRITRNSDRPRASDRTMVDTPRPGPLAQFEDPIGVATTQEGQTHPSKTSRTRAGALTVQWAGSRERISLSGRGRTFFLDIPFYRTH
jgi:hypothetical protein